MTTTKTAILIFALSQQEEAKHKSFLSGNELHQQLTGHLLKTVTSTKLDYFQYTEQEQIGDSFGERFSNAIAAIYAKGYDAVITLGNDIPNLTAKHILRAKQELEERAFVLGPSFDGGFYLMGLRKSHFEADSLANLSWNTSEITTEVKEYIQAYTSNILLLDYLYDIDVFADLKRIFKTLTSAQRELRGIVQKLIQKLVLQNTYRDMAPLLFPRMIPYNKGSPFLSL